MIEKRYGKKVDDVDDTIINITEDGNDFAWFLSDDYTDEQVDKVVQRLNELTIENEQLKHDATVLIQSNQDYRKENEQLKQYKQAVNDVLDSYYQRDLTPIEEILVGRIAKELNVDLHYKYKGDVE